MSLQSGDKVFPRETISQNVVYGLKIERLLDFSVWGKVEMEEDQERDEGRKEEVYPSMSAMANPIVRQHAMLPTSKASHRKSTMDFSRKLLDFYHACGEAPIYSFPLSLTAHRLALRRYFKVRTCNEPT